MKKYLAITLVLLLSVGCASQPKFIKTIETVTIYKPVYTPPPAIQTIDVIPRPDLKTNQLTTQDKSNPGKVAKFAIEATAQLRNYAERLETQIDLLMTIYNRPADPIPQTTRVVETINTQQ